MLCNHCKSVHYSSGSQFEACDQCLRAGKVPLAALIITPVRIAYEQIDESDFSKLVSMLYQRPYRVQQQGDMLHNGELLPITVEELESYSEEEISKALKELDTWADEPCDEDDYVDVLRWERNHYPSFDSVLIVLTLKGYLAPGDYTIHTWW